MWNSKLVVLDEPTAALGVAQTAQVLALVRRLADRGLGVIIISHNLEDVLAVADSIAVLRLGVMVAQPNKGDVSSRELVELITVGQSGTRFPGPGGPGSRRCRAPLSREGAPCRIPSRWTMTQRRPQRRFRSRPSPG